MKWSTERTRRVAYVDDLVRILVYKHIQRHVLITEEQFPARILAPVLLVVLRKWNQMRIAQVRTHPIRIPLWSYTVDR